MPTLTGAASSEEVGFVAQEQHGAEVDAALAKASTDATAERSKHTAEEAKAQAVDRARQKLGRAYPRPACRPSRAAA